MSYIDKKDINRCLVFKFFCVLSRMEFALKVTGYVIKNTVKPDWGKFAGEIKNSFNPKINENLSAACHYYFDYPPKKQVFSNETLGWECQSPTGQSDIENLILLVRRVRNNLFHGGKYNSPNNDENARNEELLRHGICILEESMNLVPEVKQAYDGA